MIINNNKPKFNMGYFLFRGCLCIPALAWACAVICAASALACAAAQTGFTVTPDHGLDALATADTVVVPGVDAGGPVTDGTLPPEVRAAKTGATRVGSAQDLGSNQTWQQLLALDANVRLSRSEPEVWTVLTRQFERALLQSSLEVCRGRRVEAAARLGMGRNTITRKLRELGMDPVDAGSDA